MSAAALVVRVPAPATRHPEFVPRQTAATESTQHRVHFATEMRAHADSLFAQGVAQGLGQCGAENDIDAQLRHASRECFGVERSQDHFSPMRRYAVPPRDEEQPRRRVEHRRHAFLPDGNSHDHEPHKGRLRASAHFSPNSGGSSSQGNVRLAEPLQNAILPGVRRGILP